MLCTSAEANKKLKELEEQRANLLHEENNTCTYNCAVGENIEDVRPVYDFATVQETLNDLDSQIRRIKHAINVFNTTTIVPEFNMTIDQMLVLIPQLTNRKDRMLRMCSRQPKARDRMNNLRNGNIIDYVYANYNVNEAKNAYNFVSDELRGAQLALDRINNSKLINIDI